MIISWPAAVCWCQRWVSGRAATRLASLPRVSRRLPAAAGPSGVAAPGVEGVGHAVQEFLRFAEELQEQMVPGAPPPPPPWCVCPACILASYEEHDAGPRLRLCITWTAQQVAGALEDTLHAVVTAAADPLTVLASPGCRHHAP